MSNHFLQVNSHSTPFSGTKLLHFFQTHKYLYEKIAKKINVNYTIVKYMLNNIFLGIFVP